MSGNKVSAILVLLLLCVSVVGIDEVSATSNEFIVNGGFETGDDTGWTGRYYDVTSEFAHSGLYSLQIWSSDGGVWQDLTKPISSACIKNFGFWHRKISDYGVSLIYAVINYDSPEPIICDAVESTVDWQYYDIMPYIPANTQIESIMIWTAKVWGEGWEEVCVDDVSLVVKLSDDGAPWWYNNPPQSQNQTGNNQQSEGWLDWRGISQRATETLKRLLGNPWILLLLIALIVWLGSYSIRRR